jgi:hypothetical protein
MGVFTGQPNQLTDRHDTAAIDRGEHDNRMESDEEYRAASLCFCLL